MLLYFLLPVNYKLVVSIKNRLQGTRCKVQVNTIHQLTNLPIKLVVSVTDY